MDPAQINYTTTEKELLAIVFALDKFCVYLLGSKVIVFFDHAALKYLLKNLHAKLRLIRWMLLLQEFNPEIRDKKDSPGCILDAEFLLVLHFYHSAPRGGHYWSTRTS
ncbi:Retrovirus-related Pol polyprotein from transposon 17.6, partial [Mucuna pruriens]